MLLVLFNVGEATYGIDATSVVEVLPIVDINRISRAPTGVVGTFNFHGAFVPVIDLGGLLLGRPAETRLSTRIVVIRYSTIGISRLVALIAENATETLRCDAADLVSPGIVSESAPYLGSFVSGPKGFIQQIEVDKLANAILPDLLLSA